MQSEVGPVIDAVYVRGLAQNIPHVAVLTARYDAVSLVAGELRGVDTGRSVLGLRPLAVSALDREHIPEVHIGMFLIECVGHVIRAARVDIYRVTDVMAEAAHIG